MRRLPVFVCLCGILGACSLFSKKPDEPTGKNGDNNASLEAPTDKLDKLDGDLDDTDGAKKPSNNATSTNEMKLAEEEPAPDAAPPVDAPAPAPEPTETPEPPPSSDANHAAQVDPIPAPQPVAAAEPPPSAAPQPVAAVVPETAPAAVGGPATVVVSEADSHRVVRYVTEDQTPVFAAPKDDAIKIRTLLRGTSLMVLVTGEWAEIVPGQHIHVAALSEKPLSYTKGAQAWQAPPAATAMKKE